MGDQPFPESVINMGQNTQESLVEPENVTCVSPRTHHDKDAKKRWND
jgi:hypothetical protein